MQGAPLPSEKLIAGPVAGVKVLLLTQQSHPGD